MIKAIPLGQPTVESRKDGTTIGGSSVNIAKHSLTCSIELDFAKIR